MTRKAVSPGTARARLRLYEKLGRDIANMRRRIDAVLAEGDLDEHERWFAEETSRTIAGQEQQLLVLASKIPDKRGNQD
jgi:hypothetical protein